MKELNLANDLKLCNQTRVLYILYKKKKYVQVFSTKFPSTLYNDE